jgi:hypothetical protein
MTTVVTLDWVPKRLGSASGSGHERVDFGLLETLWRPVERDVRRLLTFKDFVRELGLVDYWQATGNWGDFCRPVGQDDFTCT